MSRSKRKTPITPVTNTHSQEHKQWKQQCNRKLRKTPIDQDVPNNSQYKKHSGDIWDSPTDGKTSYNSLDEKYYRK